MHIPESRSARVPSSLVCGAIAFIAACASPVYNYSPSRTEISEPPLGTIQSAFIGDNLVRQGRYEEHAAILVREDTKVRGVLVRKGRYLKLGEKRNAEFYSFTSVDGGSASVNPGASPLIALQAYKNEAKLCVITNLNALFCESDVRFERVRVPVESTDSFQRTLIYSGRVGNRINVGYREFSNTLARPAFNNDVEYDLSESPVIGYKGARLEVMEATNEMIKYKVLRNFNQAAR